MRACYPDTLKIAALGIAVLAGPAIPSMAQTGSVAGRVTDASTTAPLADVYVQLYDAGGSYVTSALTDAAGTYSATGVPAGTVFARTWNQRGYVNELYSGLLCVGYCDPTLGSPIAVVAGSATTAINFTLDRGGQMAGRVTDAATGVPLYGDVFVTVVNENDFYFSSTVTDATGRYEILDGLPPGQYFVRTGNSLGYVDELYNDVPCVVSQCPTVSATPVTVSAGATATVDFALSVGGRISGRAVDVATSVPLDDVEVTIYNAARSYVTTIYADATGAYISDRGLPTGTYFAQARSLSGFIGELYDDRPCPGYCDVTRGTPIAVTTGATTSGIDFALRRGGRVAGRITDAATGLPLAQVSVSVSSGSGSGVAYGYTDDAGNYLSNEGLPTGTYYVVTFNTRGYLNEAYDDVLCIGCSGTVGTPVGVTAGSTTGGIDFALSPGGRIAGTVRSAGGAFLPGVGVSIRNASGSYITSAYTDSGGRYISQAGLLAGDYFVSAQNQLGYVNEAFDDVSCPGYCPAGTGTPVTVALGATRGAVDFDLTRGGRVEGRVADSGTGLPLADTFVYVLDASGSFVSYGRTDPFGRYRSGEGLVTGSYFALASNSIGFVDELYRNIPCPGRGCSVTLGTAFGVTLGATTPGIDFALDRGGRITGAVRDGSTGTPLANVSVEVTDDVSVYASGSTDAAGLYSVGGLPTGTYYVRTFNSIGYLDKLYRDIPCFGGCPVTTGLAVPLTLGSTVSGIDFELNRGGRITGIVTDASSGLPLAGVSVYLLDPAGRFVTSGFTDISGVYLTGSGVPNGTYFARTFNDLGFIDELYADVACVGGCSLARGTSFTVTAGSTRGGISFALAAGGRIAGQVTDSATGAPIGDVGVTVYDASGRYVTGAYTDGAGRYVTAAGLPTGTYFLATNSYVGYVDELYDGRPCAGGSCTPVTGSPVAVVAGATTNGIDFELARGGRITGRVIDGSTLLPIPDATVSFFDASGRFVTSGYTDAQGRYTTETGLLPGAYFGRTRNGLGYINRLYDGIPCPGSCNVTAGTAITVAGTATTPGINFVLGPGGRVSGTITDGATAAPLSGVTVSLFDGAGAFVSSGFTNSVGFYLSRDGVPTGNYFASTSNSSGYVNQLYAGLPCGGTCNPTTGTPIAVAVGSTTGGVSFALFRGARISGQVTKAASGEALPNVSVTLHDASGALVARTITDGLGSYLTQNGVPGGNYFARTENGQGYVNQIYSGVDCRASCNVTAGAVIPLVAGALRSGVSFALALDTDADGDGIADTIDRNQATGADQSGSVSNDFNDIPLGGSTAGAIAARGGWTVRVGDVSPGGVQASVAGAGASAARLSVCPAGGPEGVLLDVAGETAEVVCSGGGSATVRAIVATPTLQLRKPETGPATVVDLSTGQAATMGSPVTASSDNTEAILVRFVDDVGSTFGFLELDPGESVEATVLGAGAVQVTVLAGVTTVTVGAEVVTLHSGETRAFGQPRDVLVGLKARVDAHLAAGRIHSRGVAIILKAALTLAVGLLDRQDTRGAIRILRLLLDLLDTLVRFNLIAPEVRSDLRPAIETVIAALRAGP